MDPQTNHLPFSCAESGIRLLLAALKQPEEDKDKKQENYSSTSGCFFFLKK